MTKTIIAVDLEATCWSKEDNAELSENQSAESEIIEIGATRLDPATLEIVDTFERFVRPVRHPTLSNFCKTLTTITQDDVDQAQPFKETFADFVQWMGGTTEGVLMLSWGRYDHNQLRRESQKAGLPDPAWTPLNVKDEFSDWYRCQKNRKKRFGLGMAIRELGMEFTGTAHRGIDDAKNLSKIFAHIRHPEHLSDQGRDLLLFMAERHPKPTNFGHLKVRWGSGKGWFIRTNRELLRLGLIIDLGQGKGLQLTPRGQELGAKFQEEPQDS